MSNNSRRETVMERAERVYSAKTEEAEQWLETLTKGQYDGLVKLLLRGEDCRTAVLCGVLYKRHGDQRYIRYRKVRCT